MILSVWLGFTPRPPVAVIDVESRTAIAPVWLNLAECESNRTWDFRGLHFGGLQFTAATWSAFAPDHYPASAADATPLQEVAVAKRVLAVQGPGAWPVCSKVAGLTPEDAS